MSMNKIFKYVALAVLPVLIVAGCGGSFKPPQEAAEEIDKEKPPITRKEFRYDPLSLNQDQVIVPEKYALAMGDSSGSGNIDIVRIPDAGSEEFPTGVYESYRIQLFTSKEYGPAFREMNIATEVFDKKVWFDYEVPYYKVRVGDFRRRMEAERFLPAAQEAGYSTAWVVKVNTNVRTMEDIYESEIPIIDSLEQQYKNGDDEDNEPDTTGYEPEYPQN